MYFCFLSTIRLQNLQSNMNVYTFEGYKNYVNSVAFSPDENT